MLIYPAIDLYGGQAVRLVKGDYARLTGIRGLYRVSHSHFLNHKAVAEADAKAMGKPYEECNDSL